MRLEGADLREICQLNRLVAAEKRAVEVKAAEDQADNEDKDEDCQIYA